MADFFAHRRDGTPGIWDVVLEDDSQHVVHAGTPAEAADMYLNLVFAAFSKDSANEVTGFIFGAEGVERVMFDVRITPIVGKRT